MFSLLLCPMRSRRILSTLITAAMVLALVFGLTACSEPDGPYLDDECTDDSECLDGETCIDWVCEAEEEDDDNNGELDCSENPEDPDCDEPECGEDPDSGESYGTCDDDQICSDDGQCVDDTTCEPDCSNAECGDDGCGGSCGTCDSGDCDAGMCTECEESLTGDLDTMTLDGECIYVISDRVTVTSGSVLTIEAGSRIEITGLHSIVIEGILDVRGDEDDPVVFTSNRTSPSSGDWGNFHVGSGASFRTENTVIEYFSGLRAFGADLDIRSTTFRHVRPTNHLGDGVNSVNGVLDLGQGTSTIVEHSRFEDVTGSSSAAIIGLNLNGLTVTDSEFEDVTGTNISSSSFSGDSSNISVHHNWFRNGGNAVVLFNIGDSSVTNNDIRDHSTGIYVNTDAAFSRPNHTVTGNNLVDNGNYDVEVEGWADVDASSNYWGDGVDPDDRTYAGPDANLDISDPQTDELTEAGPR